MFKIFESQCLVLEISGEHHDLSQEITADPSFFGCEAYRCCQILEQVLLACGSSLQQLVRHRPGLQNQVTVPPVVGGVRFRYRCDFFMYILDDISFMTVVGYLNTSD